MAALRPTPHCLPSSAARPRDGHYCFYPLTREFIYSDLCGIIAHKDPASCPETDSILKNRRTFSRSVVLQGFSVLRAAQFNLPMPRACAQPAPSTEVTSPTAIVPVPFVKPRMDSPAPPVRTSASFHSWQTFWNPAGLVGGGSSSSCGERFRIPLASWELIACAY